MRSNATSTGAAPLPRAAKLADHLIPGLLMELRPPEAVWRDGQTAVALCLAVQEPFVTKRANGIPVVSLARRGNH